MANDRTVTGNEAQFNEKVIFLKDIEVAGTIIRPSEASADILTANHLDITGDTNLNNLKVTGLGTFTKRLDVGIGGTLFTAINYDNRTPNHQGRVGIGTTQPDGLFQVGSECLTVVVNPCRVGIATTQPNSRLEVGSGYQSLNVTSDGDVGIGSVYPSAKFQVGLANTSVSITGFGSIGVGITNPLTTFHLDGNNSEFTVVSGLGTNTLRVGIGTTQPDSIILPAGQTLNVDDSAQGTLKLGVDGSVAISRNIYDSAGSAGVNGYYLHRDATGIRWNQASPVNQEGIIVQDEGTDVPIDGTSQLFLRLNFVKTDSEGLGIDNVIPIPDPANPTAIARIQTRDYWGHTNSDNDSPIYRMTKVGVKNNSPEKDLDITGTLRATLEVEFDSTLDVDGKVTFNNDTDSSGSNTSSSLHVDGGVSVVKSIYAGQKIVAEGSQGSTSKDTGALIVASGGAGIEENLYVGGLGRFVNSQSSEASNQGALVVTGGVGIQENLYVKKLGRFESNVTSNNSADGALLVVGGVGIGEKLNVAGITRVESNQTSTASNEGALQVVGGAGIGENLNVGGLARVNSNQSSTSKDSGALVVASGGAGIEENLYVGGLGRFVNNATSNNSADGALRVTGGVGVGEKLNVAGITRVESNQGAVSSASGALQVVGGVGIGEKLYVGDDLYIADFMRVGGQSEHIGFATFNDDIYVTGLSTFVGVGTFKDDVGIGKTLWLNSYVRDVNSDTGTGENPTNVGIYRTDWRLSSVGTGVSWRPSGVQTKRTIWVTQNGNDQNSGLLEGDAKATIGAAAAIANENDTIKVRAGVYSENNPVGLRTDVSITGEDLRLVTVIPNNPSKDVFHVRNGCLVENLNFAGSSINQSHSGAGAVAFPPDTEEDQANSGYIALGPFKVAGDKRYKSPYVRNCTNFMTESIGMKIDGSHATADTFGQDLKSMVCDSFTQYNENGIGVSLTNNAYAQLVSIFTINADIGIYADTGGQCDLTNSNSSFGNFGLVAVGLGSTQFTGKVHNVNPAGNVVGSTSAENQDTVVCKDVFQKDSNTPRRPFDGQALFFKIDLDNYPDVQGTGVLDKPLQQLESIKLRSGVDLSGFSAIDPPSVIIRDADGIQEPKGPQGIIAEATATVNAKGILTDIDVIAQGRNYLPTQNIEVSIEGNTGLADAVMKPIYYTVDSSTDRTTSGPSAGICTITFNEFIPYELFPDDEFSLQRISRILTSSHSFEYIGSGTDINTSTPLQGAIPIKENEIVASDGAQIPFTSTDQKGNFDIGEGIQIDQTTSTIRGRDFSRAIQAEVTPLILALR